MSKFLREPTASVNDFAERKGTAQRLIPALGKTILLLDAVPTLPVDMQRIEGYAAQHLEALQHPHGIMNRCYFIAEAAYNARRATGIIYTEQGAQQLVGWANHYVNTDKPGDGTALVVDLTASSNIDDGRGNFDVLALRFPDTTNLLEHVGELYGGTWQVKR